MIQVLIDHVEKNFKWIDVINPDADELSKLAAQYRLHSTSVQDCLDPKHLPKLEVIEGTTFLILRTLEPDSSNDSDTVQELTTKIAMFFNKNLLITIHRVKLNYLEEIKKKWDEYELDKKNTEFTLIHDIIKNVLLSFEAEVTKSYTEIETCETAIFKSRKPEFMINELYQLRRKAAIFKRMLYLTKEIINRLKTNSDIDEPYLQDLKETVSSLYYSGEDQVESVNNLLNLHLSYESHKTNEVIRVLTIFSVFFLPLTFIAGIYGMNFDFMPELNWKFGYPGALVLMVAIAGGVYFWFRKRNWL
jgi:magnesium transporter